MVVVVTIGDLHFKKDTSTITDLVIHKISEQISKVNPDIVVFLGDILDTHERIDMKTQNKAVRFIKSIAAKDINVIVIIGNHERPDGTCFLTEDSSFYSIKGTPNVHIADRVLDLKWEMDGTKDKIRFVFVPYVQVGRFHEALDTLETKVMDKDNRVTAIFCHQEFKGVKIGSYISKTGDEWSESNPLVISGHIHTFQQPQSNIVYSGTPYQQSYSDSSKKGILISEFFSGKPPSINFLELEIRKKKIIRLKPSEIDTFIPPPNCDVQVDIVGTSDEIKHLNSKGIISQMRSKGVNVSLSTERSLNIANPENKSFRDLLLDMIKNDGDANNIFNEIFSQQQGSTMTLAPSVSLGELMKSADNVKLTKPVNTGQLLTSLLSQVHTVGSPVQTPGQNLGLISPISQTERAPIDATGNKLDSSIQNNSTPVSLSNLLNGPSNENASQVKLTPVPNQSQSSPSLFPESGNNNYTPIGQVSPIPTDMFRSQPLPSGTPPPTPTTNSNLLDSLLTSASKEKEKPKNILLESILNSNNSN